MTVIAYISDPTVAVKILTHLGLPTTSPPLAPARLPAQAFFFEDDGALDVGPQRLCGGVFFTKCSYDAATGKWGGWD